MKNSVKYLLRKYMKVFCRFYVKFTHVFMWKITVLEHVTRDRSVYTSHNDDFSATNFICLFIVNYVIIF